MTFAYESDLFTSTEISELGRLYSDVLESIARDSNENVSAAFVDRAAQRRIANQVLSIRELAAVHTVYVPPANEIEEKLKQLYEEVLSVQSIGREHNFFESGGNSILAARLAARIRHTFGKEFQLSNLFENPTIEQLATVIAAEAPQNTVLQSVPRARRELVKVRVLSPE
jgi:aryl carrier-like protein